jgi:isoaspartyl peptidase/L-asparaginase-like protein (Ntn-hydrolase superfamily)
VRRYHPIMPGPLIISTWSFGRRGNDAAWAALGGGGSSLNAVETACRVIEADASVDSVGFGGLPDRDGRVTLDACIMLSPAECGSVCAISRSMHPASIARRVMERTEHVMLAGPGADEFAAAQGFAQDRLLSDEARTAWEQWRLHPDPIDQSRDALDASSPRRDSLRPVDRDGSGRLFRSPSSSLAASDESRWAGHDTIGVLALDARGVLAGACSTSGMPYKLPGRVGDSPIIGHGLYVDPRHGAATATGTGELIMGVCGSFLAVELMRQGAKPIDALVAVLGRIVAEYTLRDRDQVAMVALTPQGEYASAALRNGYKTSVCDAAGSRVIEPDLIALNES